jgi:hypothetical protein
MGDHPITREGNVREILVGITLVDYSDEGDFSSLGMLITDSLLSHDTEALRAMHDGLRSVYGKYRERTDHRVDLGRILGLIDVTHWALRRVD